MSRLLAALTAASLFMAAGVATAEGPGAVVIGPYVQHLTRDGFTVIFETRAPTEARVRAGAAFGRSAGSHHEVVLRGLPVGVPISYRVFLGGEMAPAGGGEVVLPRPSKRLHFVVYGDTRDSATVPLELAQKIRGLRPDLVLHTGDLVATGGKLPDWETFFASSAPLMRDLPLYVALGNHELVDDPEATHFRRFFSLPDGGRDRLYYTFRSGPAAFVVLDANHPSPAQTTWLAETLKRARHDKVAHVFVLQHQGPLSVAEHCGAGPQQADWLTLFERHRVRAVFAGHDHVYERLERNGVRYYVSGGGGAPLYAQKSCSIADRAAVREFRPIHHFLSVHVDGDEVEVVGIPLDGDRPFDRLRFGADEPPFAMGAPPLFSAHRGQGRATATLAGGAALALFALLGARFRRRRAG